MPQKTTLLRAHLRVQMAQRLCRNALQRLDPEEPRTMDRLTKASYLLDLARERTSSLPETAALGDGRWVRVCVRPTTICGPKLS